MDVVRVLVAEFHELIVERRPHFHGKASHDVLDEGLGDGDAVEVLHLVELLDNFQIGLQGFNLGGQILGNILNGFISGEEVEDLVNVSVEDVNAPEFFNQFDLEDIPVGDIVEGSPLVLWDGLKGDDELDRVVAIDEVESVQGGGQPWVEIVG